MNANQAREPTPYEITASHQEVHVWRIGLEQPEEVVRELRNQLSDDECRRADRFYAETHRARFVVGRASMRTVLGRYLGEEPARLNFPTNPQGKPGLEGTRLEFNLSHSANLAVLAVTLERRVGIDVEQLRPMPEEDRIAARFFSAPECEAFLKLPAARRNAAFFSIWTRKEAYIKAIGLGLAMPLDRFDVPAHDEFLNELVPVLSRSDEPGSWMLRDFSAGEGYLGAIVAEGLDWAVRLFAFDPASG